MDLNVHSGVCPHWYKEFKHEGSFFYSPYYSNAREGKALFEHIKFLLCDFRINVFDYDEDKTCYTPRACFDFKWRSTPISHQKKPISAMKREFKKFLADIQDEDAVLTKTDVHDILSAFKEAEASAVMNCYKQNGKVSRREVDEILYKCKSLQDIAREEGYKGEF